MTGAAAGGGAGTRRVGEAAGGHRSTRAELLRRLGPCLDAAGFYLEDVSVRRAGSRSVVQVVVDRDGGVDLDAVAEASRIVCAELDSGTDPDLGSGTDPGGGSGPGNDPGGHPGGSPEGGGAFAGSYVLEVSSPGVDRPLTMPRHWRRAAGRLVSVQTRDGRRILGRVGEVSEDAVELVLPPPAAGSAGSGGGRRQPKQPPKKAVQRTSVPGASLAGHDTVLVRYGEVTRALVQVEFGPMTGVTEFGTGADTDEEMGS